MGKEEQASKQAHRESGLEPHLSSDSFPNHWSGPSQWYPWLTLTWQAAKNQHVHDNMNAHPCYFERGNGPGLKTGILRLVLIFATMAVITMEIILLLFWHSFLLTSQSDARMEPWSYNPGELTEIIVCNDYKAIDTSWNLMSKDLSSRDDLPKIFLIRAFSTFCQVEKSS